MSLSKLLIIFITIVFALNGYYLESNCENRVIFFDVEQGDSALIQIDCFEILIDGGPGDYVLTSLGKYMNPWDMEIDIVILSHPHLDHLGGLLDVFEKFEVKEVWLNPVCYLSPYYEAFFISGINSKAINSNMILRLSNGYLKVLYPFNNDNPVVCEGSGYLKPFGQNVNNDSVVVQLNYYNKKILFMGDAEKELEVELLKNDMVEDVDILKAGHHCSDTSSTEKFLKKVDPEIAICSVGENNRYGHPSLETIDRFEELDIKYRLTSDSGDLVLYLE